MGRRLSGPQAHCAKNVQARHTRDMGLSRVFNVERLRPYLDDPTVSTATRVHARHHQRRLPRTELHRRRLPAAPARHSWWQG